jgi:hypothetical protein
VPKNASFNVYGAKDLQEEFKAFGNMLPQDMLDVNMEMLQYIEKKLHLLHKVDSCVL